MKNKIAVILSTYNGEKYVAEQIESIMEQSYSNFDLFIHDDGSNDTTEDIINDYAKKYENIKVIVRQKGLGYPSCFIEMLKQVDEYEFYAFSDQDDVWNANKLKNAVECLKMLNKELPNLYYTAVEYTDANLHHIRSSRFAKGKNGICKLNLQALLLGGEAMGMTFVFNNTAKNALVKANVTRNYKDWFLKLYCASCGEVYYNPVPSAKYRRHDWAVTNGSNPSGKIKRYLSQLCEIFFYPHTFDNQKYILDYMIKSCYNSVHNEDLELISLFTSTNSFCNRVKKITWKRRFRSRIIDELGYRFAFLLGRI